MTMLKDLLAALAAGTSLAAAALFTPATHAQSWDEDGRDTDTAYSDNWAFQEDYGDNWTEDDYGWFDSNHDYDTDDEWFDDWYDDSDEWF